MWYVLQTMTSEEDKCKLLCELHIPSGCYSELFIPMCITKKHFKKEWHDIKKPLFPGYVFVDTDHIEDFAKSLIHVKCFAKLLKVGDEITPVSAEERTFLESLMDTDYVISYSQGFLVGDKVFITEGALRNQTALIQKVDRHRRIAMLDVNLFGRSTLVEVGFGAFARYTPEQWESIRKEALAAQEKEAIQNLPGETVRVQSGVFEGMTGTLVSINQKGDCTTEILLFGKPTKVVLNRSEIEVIPD